MAGFCRSVYETANRPLRGLIRVGPFTVSFSYLNLDGHVVQGSDSQTIDIHITYCLYVVYLLRYDSSWSPFFWGCFFRLICFFSFLLGVVYQINPWPDRIGQINGRAWRDCNCSIPISWGKFFVHCHFQS